MLASILPGRWTAPRHGTTGIAALNARTPRAIATGLDGGDGMGVDDEDVVVTGRTVAYDGFFKITKWTLRHGLFGGGMGPEITREVFERGDSVAVLPYDPVTDRVLLIRQFLPGAHAAGRPAIALQVVAGMVDKANETFEDVARREALEEAGTELGELVAGPPFLPSPGGSSERIVTFCARADLSGAGGVHGLASEHEDIRVETMAADEAVARLDDGTVEAGPAVVLLSWFARNKDRLRAGWGGGPDTPDGIGQAVAALQALSPDERREVMTEFCEGCGSDNPGCNCRRDE